MRMRREADAGVGARPGGMEREHQKSRALERRLITGLEQ